MEPIKWREKMTDLTEKYKYAALIILLGIGILLFPAKRTDETELPDPVEDTQSQISLSQELAQILSTIDGAGEVKVMLTVSQGEKTVYQTDSDVTDQSSNSSTVIITDESRTEAGLVRQILPEQYQGAIIVCHGADDPSVRLAIVEAVSDVTGLGADRISVLKMK